MGDSGFERFDRIVVINLAERTDRRREMESELRRAGIDPASPRVEFFRAIRPASWVGWPSVGAKGCFLSHLGALEASEARGDATLLMLEDDCEFACVPDGVSHDLLRGLAGARWDLAYVGHQLPLEGSARWVESREPVGLSHCYAVTASGRRRLIAFLHTVASRPGGHPRGGPMHYDGALCTFRAQNPDIVTLFAWPSLASQRASRSDVTPGRYDRIPMLRGVVGAARSLRRRLLAR